MTTTPDSARRRTALRLNYVRGDGSANPDPIVLVVQHPVTGEELRDPDGTPAVTITLRSISDEERRGIVEMFRTLEKDPAGGRGLLERVDQQAVTDEILRRGILRWEGLVGSDDQPLVCTDQTKILLDRFLQLQVSRKLFNAEAVEVLAASFR